MRILVVWEPILASDWGRPRRGSLARIGDGRAMQFWDPQHLVAQRLRADLQSIPGYSDPSCCISKGNFWDMAFLFPPNTRWPHADTAPQLYGGPVYKFADKLEIALR